MRLFELMTLGVLAFSLGIWPNTRAEDSLPRAEGPDKQAMIEKISVVFTGMLPSSEDVERVGNGSLDLEEYFDSLRQNPAVEQKLVDYWSSVLKIRDRFEPVRVHAVAPGTTRVTERLENRFTNFTFENSKILEISSLPRHDTYNEIRGRTACSQPRISRVYPNETVRTDSAIAREREKCALIVDAAERTACLDKWTRYETVERPAQLARLDQVNCECGTEQTVRPWWNPEEPARACSDAVAACGSDLKGCHILDGRIDSRFAARGYRNKYHPSNFYGTDVIDALTLEPGMIIARNVIEGEDFRNVLTTTSTYLNGSAEHYLSTIGSLIVRNGPPNSFKTASGESTLLPDQASRRSYRKVERGAGHAGILTTPMFHQVTNGYRAKINRIYEGFLCNRFVIKANVPPSPSNITDLEIREPCAQCHRIIEPMGRYMGRWPQEGLNYQYFAAQPAAGSFGAHSGSDALGLGSAVSMQPQFDTCAVQRAFEIAMGREISEPEARALMPQLLNVFRQNNRQLWPVLKAIVTSPNFKGTLQ